jgi:hypothetical protein
LGTIFLAWKKAAEDKTIIRCMRDSDAGNS